MEIKQGLPTNEEILTLARDIGNKWKFLGRALHIPEEDLEAVEEEENKLFEKSYKMLIKWKQINGLDATYIRLDQGLQHCIVHRKDLAEKYCYVEQHIPPPLPVEEIKKS